ncbi:phosphatidate cytidylyltransferase [Paenimyroides ceti]
MSENVIRSLSGIVYILLLIGATLYSDWTFQLLFLFFLLTGVYEFSKLYRISLKTAVIATGLSLIVFYLIHKYSELSALLLIGLPFSVYLIVDLFKNKLKIKEASFAKVLFLSGYVLIPFLILLQLPFLTDTYNPFIIIGIFILIWVNDTFAYICGRAFGKHKLYEKISPKKTIEGFIGGFIASVCAAYILSIYFQYFTVTTGIISALILSLFGTIGDLVESKFKRQAQVKDSGNIMPGHGGILDRLDSVLFAAPFIFLMYQILL